MCPFKVSLGVFKMFLGRELRCPASHEGETSYLPEVCPNGASQHVLVDIMNNAALSLQLMEKDFVVSHHRPTSTPT